MEIEVRQVLLLEFELVLFLELEPVLLPEFELVLPLTFLQMTILLANQLDYTSCMH